MRVIQSKSLKLQSQDYESYVFRPAIYLLSLKAAITPAKAKTTIADPIITYRQTRVGEPTAARSCSGDWAAEGGLDSMDWLCKVSANPMMAVL